MIKLKGGVRAAYVPLSTSSLHEVWFCLPRFLLDGLGLHLRVRRVDDPAILLPTDRADCSVHHRQELVLVVFAFIDMELAAVHRLSPFASSQSN